MVRSWGSVNTITDSIVSGVVEDIFDEVNADTGGGVLADNGGSVQRSSRCAVIVNLRLQHFCCFGEGWFQDAHQCWFSVSAREI